MKIEKASGMGAADDWQKRIVDVEQPTTDKEFADLQARLEKMGGLRVQARFRPREYYWAESPIAER